MASTNSNVWWILRRLETKEDLMCPLKAEVRTVRRKASFLKAFLSCRGKWNTEDRNLQARLFRIQTVFQTTDHDLRRLWVDFNKISSENYWSMQMNFNKISSEKYWSMPMNMDNLLSHMLERFELLNPDIQEVYTILSKSSRSITDMNDEAAKENLNSLIEEIEALLRYDAEFVGPVKEELEAVQESLRFLRNFLRFTAKRCSKLGKLKDLLIHTEFLDNISCLLYLCSVNEKMNDRMANEMKMQLSSELQKFSPAQPDVREIYIKSLKASKPAQVNSNLVDKSDLDFLDSLRDYMLVLSDTKLRFMTPIKNQILSLYEELRFLITYFAMDSSLGEHIENDQIFKDLSELISAVIDEFGYVICSLLDEEMARELELNDKVSDMIAIIGVAKEDTRKMYDLYVPKSLRYNFPRTNGQGFIGYFLRNLKELLNTKADLVAPLKYHIEIVQRELLSVKEDFSEAAKQPRHCEVLQSQWTRFIDTAYQTEYVIDSFVAGDGTLCCHKLGLFNVIEEIKTIKTELKATKSKITSLHKPSCIPPQISLEANFPKDNAVLSFQERLADKETTTKLVIFGEEAEEIRERLTNPSHEKLNFLSIVGMPGIGKTTLADSVFQHPSVTHYFHVRARCSVSQVHDKRRLLREILQEVTGESNQYSDDDLEQKLYRSLKGRRFLIFMDDIWDIQPWEDIRASFPDDENGSRIIFTSRFDGIASQAGSESINYCLSPLSDDRSWEMLQVKIFGNKSCPRELLRVGCEIAAKCKGLPLTVDLIAGILRVTERKKWKKVAESMTTLLLDDPQGRCRKVLELSYNNLPNQLKPCFLYFAAFPEDADIPTRKLILLWIAEGFVQLQQGDPRSLEGAAEEILNDLVARNLVTVSKRKLLGGVKASRIHDLLLEFALAKAQDESFMLKIDSKPGYQWPDCYRLCIHQFHESIPSGRRARALLICYAREIRHTLNLSDFKLLRVLHIPDGYFDAAIFTLIHLRFLSIRTFDVQKVLSKIHKLRNLETFVLAGRQYDGYLYLDNICNMVKLRHLFYRGYVSLYYGEKILEKSFLFDNLRILKGVMASYAEDIEKMLKLMPNLVKLKIGFHNRDGYCYRFPKLDFLKKLESLELEHVNFLARDSNPCKIISFPPYIKKLVLSNFGVPWTEISEIGNFEYLEILKFGYQAFVGPIWNMIDGQFPKLKYLGFFDLDIKEWNASENHLSCLEKLHVESCKKLKELPSCLAEIATLKKIILLFCSKSAENSAKRIKEEQEETGNEQLVVDIKLSI